MSQEIYSEEKHKEIARYMKFQRTFFIKKENAELNCVICNSCFSNSYPHKCDNLKWLSKNAIIKIKPLI